jgi:HK97 family phage portal protein
MSFLDKVLGRRSGGPGAPALECLFASGDRPVTDYTAKESRADKVDYLGIGRSKYASGQPPQIYDSAIAALKAFPLIYGCITAVSDAVAPLTVRVYDVKGGSREEVPDHPFYQLFSRPNPFQGSFEFLEEVQQSLELYVLNPKYIAIIPDAKKKVKEYRYVINGNTVKYKPEEIIHVKYHDVEDPYVGLPPLSVASSVLSFEANRLAFASQFFENGAIPAGVLETEQTLGETLLKKLRREWSAIHRGVANSHKVAILQGGLVYKPVASPLKDLDFSGLKKLGRDDILTLFKIPESILGSQEGTGSDEGKSALTAFWRSCIVPRLRRLESGLNRGLAVEMFGEGTTVFEFDLTEVVALQEDKTAQASYVVKLVESSIMTPNEGRAVFGLPPSAEPYADALLVSNSFFGNQMMPASEASAAASAGGAGSTEEKPATKPKPAAPKPSEPKPKK